MYGKNKNPKAVITARNITTSTTADDGDRWQGGIWRELSDLRFFDFPKSREFAMDGGWSTEEL